MAVIPHHRLTFRGVFGQASGPIETWSVNLAMSNDPTNATPAALTTLAGLAKTAWTTHMAPLYSSLTGLVQVRVASLGSDGRVVQTGAGAYVQGDWLGDQRGTTAQGSWGAYPLQTALVASLVTGRAGPAGKGRIFLPFPETMQLGNDYRITTTQATTAATKVKDFIAALNTALGNQVTVVGATSSITGKEATLSTVTGVRVGRVPDTMRSRRGDAIEGYVSVSL